MAQADFTRIASNIGALASLYSLRKTNNTLGVHQNRLATGRRINSAEEDPAGLSIGTKMFARSEGLKVALDNIGDAKNLLSVAEASLQRMSDILVQMRSKAEAAANDTLGSTERNAIASQLSQFAQEIDTIVAETKWNDNKLLDGLQAWAGQGNKIIFQTGANTGETTELTSANFGAVSVAALSLATITATSEASETEDADSVLNEAAMTAGNATFANLSELETGTYTISVVIGTTDGSASDSYIQILDSSGNPLLVDADGADGGLVDNKLTFAYDAASASDLNLGVGLAIQVADGLAGGSYSATVTYTKAGTYTVDVGDNTAASAYMTVVDGAITEISNRLATVGSLMARLSFKEEVVSVAQVNTEAAYNRIMNADMAYEQTQATKLAILQQTSLAMLGQANMMPQNILALFR
ncbi:MAG: flagellin [Anaerolineae bacterium]|nr:flagellin [Anaerolineae bacterium]